MSERYQIKAKIGQGGIGAVYRAFDTHLQREVALKRLLPPDESESFDEDPTKSLFKEAHLLSALQHPNVVSVYDVGNDDDGMFVVMELVDGETFDQVVERGLLTEDDFAEMVSQTLEALIAAQDKALVHRDIKPTNLMVKWLPSGKFQFKLLDFGLAKFSPRPSQQTIGLNDAILGSIHFMAPEQFERLPLDGRTDLYAIGCMYYYGLTGRYPFDGDTAAEVMAAHLSHRFTPMMELRPDITKRTSDWVLWLMSRDMNQRPASAQEALEVFFNPDILVPGVQMATSKLILPGAGGLAPKLGALPGSTGPVRPGSGPVRPGSATARQGSGPVRLGSSPVRLGSSPVRLGSSPVRVGARPGTGGVHVTPTPSGHTTGYQAIDSDNPQHPVHHTQPAKSPLKQWTLISIVSAVVILGVGTCAVVSRNKAGSEHSKVFEYLNNEEQVAGNAQWVRELVPYLTPAADVKNRDDVIGRTLSKLEKMDGDDVDAALIEQLPKARGKSQELLIGVVAKRGIRDAIPALTKIAQDSDPTAARRAIEAMSLLGDSRDAATIMGVLVATKDASLMRSCETVMEVLIENTSSKGEMVTALKRGLEASAPKSAQQATLRLLGKTGAPEAAAALENVLNANDADLQLAAVTALRDWPNDSQLDKLAALAESSNDPAVQNEAFSSYVRALAVNQDRTRNQAAHKAWWAKAQKLLNNSDRKRTFLTGLAMVPEDFALAMAAQLEADPDIPVRTLATEAKKNIQTAMATKPKAR